MPEEQASKPTAIDRRRALQTPSGDLTNPGEVDAQDGFSKFLTRTAFLQPDARSADCEPFTVDGEPTREIPQSRKAATDDGVDTADGLTLVTRREGQDG